jgi:hypothetical protein
LVFVAHLSGDSSFDPLIADGFLVKSTGLLEVGHAISVFTSIATRDAQVVVEVLQDTSKGLLELERKRFKVFESRRELRLCIMIFFAVEKVDSIFKIENSF